MRLTRYKTIINPIRLGNYKRRQAFQNLTSHVAKIPTITTARIRDKFIAPNGLFNTWWGVPLSGRVNLQQHDKLVEHLMIARRLCWPKNCSAVTLKPMIIKLPIMCASWAQSSRLQWTDEICFVFCDTVYLPMNVHPFIGFSKLIIRCPESAAVMTRS